MIATRDDSLAHSAPMPYGRMSRHQRQLNPAIADEPANHPESRWSTGRIEPSRNRCQEYAAGRRALTVAGPPGSNAAAGISTAVMKLLAHQRHAHDQCSQEAAASWCSDPAQGQGFRVAGVAAHRQHDRDTGLRSRQAQCQLRKQDKAPSPASSTGCRAAQQRGLQLSISGVCCQRQGSRRRGRRCSARCKASTTMPTAMVMAWPSLSGRPPRINSRAMVRQRQVVECRRRQRPVFESGARRRHATRLADRDHEPSRRKAEETENDRLALPFRKQFSGIRMLSCP